VALGADYSIFTGHSDIRGQDLTPALQQQLALVVPPGVPVSVPFDSTTYTFRAGPQINFRQLKWVTFFVRPANRRHPRNDHAETIKDKMQILKLVLQHLRPALVHKRRRLTTNGASYRVEPEYMEFDCDSKAICRASDQSRI
jgi:hypothetical protein